MDEETPSGGMDDTKDKMYRGLKKATVIGVIALHLGLLMILIGTYDNLIDDGPNARFIGKLFVIMGAGCMVIPAILIGLYARSMSDIVRFGCLLFAGTIISFEILSLV